jgi:DNA polymerase/3'-5' exonuclease PolX
LAKQETENKFKAIAYRKAAASIMELTVKIKSGKEAMGLVSNHNLLIL